MAFPRPTAETLERRVAAEMAMRQGLGALLEEGTFRVVSDVIAGQSHGNYGAVELMSRQILPSTADPEWLERHAAEYLMTRKPAAQAAGFVTVTGSVGATVTAGYVLQRADGVRFLVDATTVLSSSSQDIAVTAESGGAATNCDIGMPLTFTAALPAVNVQAVVADDGDGRGLSGGTDAETDAQLAARIRQRRSNALNGGSVADYVRWTLEVPGVTRVWVREEWLGLGTVGVGFVLDGDPISIIPSPGKVDEVEAYLTDPSRKPVTAKVFPFAPTPKLLDITIALAPNTADVREAVTTALKDLIAREASLGKTHYLSQIVGAISNAVGEDHHELTVPSADVVCQPHEILVLGTITWS